VARPRTVTDEQIVEGAVRAIGTHGPVKVTLAHVAAEVGITPAAIVQRFGSKEALLLAIGEASGAALSDLVDRLLERRPPLEALHRFLAEQVQPLRTPQQMANHLAFLHLDLADPDLRRRARRHGAELLDSIRRLLHAAVDAGELRSGDVDELAIDVYTAYNGALISWAMVGSGALTTWLRARIDRTLSPSRSTAS
jgi:AcrR family transcriptional regulator